MLGIVASQEQCASFFFELVTVINIIYKEGSLDHVMFYCFGNGINLHVFIQKNDPRKNL